jgi:hypothetical protein
VLQIRVGLYAIRQGETGKKGAIYALFLHLRRVLGLPRPQARSLTTLTLRPSQSGAPCAGTENREMTHLSAPTFRVNPRPCQLIETFLGWALKT